jgi:hypothetical protein
MGLDSIQFRFPEIDQYIADFEDLIRKAGYTIGNDETITLFLKGLWSSPDIFEKVVEKDPQNYFQLKDAAIAVTKTWQLLNALCHNTSGFNAFQQNRPRQPFFQRGPSNQGPPCGPPPAPWYNLSNALLWMRNTAVPIDTSARSRAPNNWQGRNQQFRGNITQMEGAPPPRTKGPCFKCGKMGHFTRECWQNLWINWAETFPNSCLAQDYIDQQEDMTGIQAPIDPTNGLDNALAMFNLLSLEQKDEMINRYEGKREDFPAA